MKKTNNKGFSLVELIVVIAIMAVLVGILAPQFLKYVNNSKVSTDITNAEEIATTTNVLISDTVLTSTASTDVTLSATATATTDEGKIGAALGKFPTPKYNPADSWVVTYSQGTGVTKITLGGVQIYPDAGKTDGTETTLYNKYRK